MLTKRHLRPHFVRFLNRQLDNQDLPAETREKIWKVLEDPTKVDALNDQVHGLIVKDTALAGYDVDKIGAIGDGTFWQQLFAFLNAHWAEIFALILKLLGV